MERPERRESDDECDNGDGFGATPSKRSSSSNPAATPKGRSKPTQEAKGNVATKKAKKANLSHAY